MPRLRPRCQKPQSVLCSSAPLHVLDRALKERRNQSYNTRTCRREFTCSLSVTGGCNAHCPQNPLRNLLHNLLQNRQLEGMEQMERMERMERMVRMERMEGGTGWSAWSGGSGWS